MVMWMVAFLLLVPASLAGSSNELNHLPTLDYGRELRIVSTKMTPYLMEENGKYVGLIPDLVDEIARRLRFDYEISLQTKFGGLNKDTNIWSGLIGDVVRNEQTNGTEGADIAAASILVTSKRLKAVDFVKPFKGAGLSVLVKKPTRPQSSQVQWWFFDIFSPFTLTVWMVAVCCYIIVSILLWVMSKWNPYEWRGFCFDNPHNNGPEVAASEAFSLAGCFWFIFSAAAKQGFDRGPRSAAGRLLSVSWFIFSTIFISSFVAGVFVNLFWGSFPHYTPDMQHESLTFEDMIWRSTYGLGFDMGVVNGSSVDRYIRNVATGKQFEMLRSYLDSERGRSQSPQSTVDAILTKVRRENYGLMLNHLDAAYFANHHPCDLAVIDTNYGVKSYGFALPKNSYAMKKALDLTLLQLNEEGVIQHLEQKWEKDHGACWNVTRWQKKKDTVTSLTFDTERPAAVSVVTFGGALLLLLGGTILSACASLAEYLFSKNASVGPGLPQQELQNEA